MCQSSLQYGNPSTLRAPLQLREEQLLALAAIVNAHTNPRLPLRSDPIDFRSRFEQEVSVREELLRECGERLESIIARVEKQGAEVWFNCEQYRTKSQSDLVELLRKAALAPAMRKAAQAIAKRGSLGLKTAAPVLPVSPRVCEFTEQHVLLRTAQSPVPSKAQTESMDNTAHVFRSDGYIQGA